MTVAKLIIITVIGVGGSERALVDYSNAGTRRTSLQHPHIQPVAAPRVREPEHIVLQGATVSLKNSSIILGHSKVIFSMGQL